MGFSKATASNGGSSTAHTASKFKQFFTGKFGAALALCLSSGLVNAAALHVNCTNNVADTAALRNTINGSAAGDQINIHGVCLVNQTIVLKGGRSYLGDIRTDGSATQIRQANGANLPAVLASDSWDNNTAWVGEPIRIAHLQVDGNKANNASGTVGIMVRSWLAVIEDVGVAKTSGDGIRITNLSKNNTALTSSMVNGRISNVFIEDVNGSGINVVDTGNSITDWDVIDTWIGTTGWHGIYLANAAGWKVRGNHLYNIGRDAIYANRCWATTIDGNYIEDFGNAGASAANYGIACAMTTGNIASTIIGNKVFMLKPLMNSTTYRYIGVPAINYAGSATINVVDNVIVGNNTSTNNEAGLYYSTWCPCGGGTTLNVFSNNNVTNIAPNINPTTYQYSKYQPYGTLNYFSAGK